MKNIEIHTRLLNLRPALTDLRTSSLHDVWQREVNYAHGKSASLNNGDSFIVMATNAQWIEEQIRFAGFIERQKSIDLLCVMAIVLLLKRQSQLISPFGIRRNKQNVEKR